MDITSKLKAVVANCESVDPFFSWEPCENCGDTLGGNRYDITYRETLDGDIFTAEVCPDCMVALCS